MSSNQSLQTQSFETKIRSSSGFKWLAGGRYPALAVFFLLAVAVSWGREKKGVVHYGVGLIVNLPLPEAEVAQVVADVSENTIIRGTKEYNKDEYVSGAVAATTTPVFPPWKEGGKVFYKVRREALDPLNFKNGGDLGTLAVRYVVQPQGDKNTILRIDALFVEDFRHATHQSNGSVESSEYKDIHDRLDAVELMKKQTADALEAKEARAAKHNAGAGAESMSSSLAGKTTEETAGKTTGEISRPEDREETTGAPAPGGSNTATSAQESPAMQPSAYQQPGETLDQHVANLRRQVERLVKKPGAPLQSAPFHSATTLKSLEPGSQVLILISTQYWYGVETRDGQHGWLLRDQLEQLP